MRFQKTKPVSCRDTPRGYFKVKPFNRAPFMPTTTSYLIEAFKDRVSGDGAFTGKCTDWLRRNVACEHMLLTTSGSHALDMAARLCNLKPGDEAIMPSYTFSSTANSFVGLGVKAVFVDIRPDTMNIDESLIEDAITPRTKVIVPMHYAGVSCEMDAIMDIAARHNLKVVEDAAQALMSSYKGRPLGGIGDFGCFSFHETKNYSMGEGGALAIAEAKASESAEIMREKGTDRSRFFRGQVDKYSWVEWGSSYLPSDLNAAYLWSQLEMAEDINRDRLDSWNMYYQELSPLAEKGLLELPHIPEACVHNAHMFYLKAKDLEQRSDLLNRLHNKGLNAVYHYVPLHSAQAGLKYGRFHGNDHFTTRESERLIRLPLYYGIERDYINAVLNAVKDYFQS